MTCRLITDSIVQAQEYLIFEKKKQRTKFAQNWKKKSALSCHPPSVIWDHTAKNMAPNNSKETNIDFTGSEQNICKMVNFNLENHTEYLKGYAF